ncbi:amino acid permease [Streptomyces mirabilis]|uniref:amino acid permease n=1 Tax=Streptomyces mirabilis TaxID=68239 RepID=UPI0036536F7F
MTTDSAITNTPPTTSAPHDGEGYSHALGNRQVGMIAIGGAIGVGLFLGAGKRLVTMGPSLIFAYAICGIAAFFVMRALAELVLHKPTAGSFVNYSREFVGPWAGFVTGWMYWLNWAMAGVAEITAVGEYMHKWLPHLPNWISCLVALGLLVLANMVSVKVFGETEFWFSVLKVTAIVVFLVVGLGLLFSHAHIGHYTASPSNIVDHGGLFPHGFGVFLLAFQGVIFAFAGIELVGVAAGEAKDPHKIIPKAVNSVIWRIAVFYIGSVLLLTMLMPWSGYHAGESPFVTLFSSLGIPGVGDVMNLIVLTAALSSTNSGLYSTGRILRALADRGEAPKFTVKMSRRHVPYGAIALTGVVYLLGIALNYVVPSQAFDVASEISSLGVIFTWGMLIICQMRLRKKAMAGELERPAFRMPGAPFTGWATLGFLALVVVLMGFAGGSTAIAFWSIPVLLIVFFVSWRVISRRDCERLEVS